MLTDCIINFLADPMHKASWTSHEALTAKYSRLSNAPPPISLRTRANDLKQIILKYLRSILHPRCELFADGDHIYSSTSSNGIPNTNPANDTSLTMHNKVARSKQSPHSSTSICLTNGLRTSYQAPRHDHPWVPHLANPPLNPIKYTHQSPSYHTFVAWS